MEVGGALREAAENHAGHAAGASKMGEDSADRQWGGALGRKTVDACGDGGESEGSETGFVSEPQAFPVAGDEQGILARAAAPPDGTDGVDDVAGRQAEAGCEARRTGRAAAQRPAMRDQLRPGGPVDRAVHAAAPEQ